MKANNIQTTTACENKYLVKIPNFYTNTQLEQM